MLQVVFNISWQQHITNKELYGDLPKVSDKVAARRHKLAGTVSSTQSYQHPHYMN